MVHPLLEAAISLASSLGVATAAHAIAALASGRYPSEICTDGKRTRRGLAEAVREVGREAPLLIRRKALELEQGRL